MCLVDDSTRCARHATRALGSYVQGSTTPTGQAHELCPKWIGTGSVRHVSTRFWIAPSSIQLGSLQSSSLPSLAHHPACETDGALLVQEVRSMVWMGRRSSYYWGTLWTPPDGQWRPDT